MEITLLYFDGCPSWRLAAERLDALALTDPITVRRQLVETDEEAVRVGFLGSPSLQLDGYDLFPDPSAQVGFSCRRYRTPDGLQGAPTAKQIMEAITSTLETRGAA